jgi:hypothetical protein
MIKCCDFHARADLTRAGCDFCGNQDKSGLVCGVDAEAGYDADPLIRQCADPDACVVRYRARHKQPPVMLSASASDLLAVVRGLQAPYLQQAQRAFLARQAAQARVAQLQAELERQPGAGDDVPVPGRTRRRRGRVRSVRPRYR